jgi:O6-methylguanine-DNA--protein-cysteine methyltransferase
VNSNGSLGGFSSGLWRKQKLLELEARTSAWI